MVNFKIISIIGLLLIFILFPIVSATTVAELSWSTIVPYGVTATDTTQYGNYLYAGLANGSIYAYDNENVIQFKYHTSGGIKKIVADSTGGLVWSNDAGEFGYLDAGGNVLSQFDHHGANITDISLSKSGNYAVTELTPGNIFVYSKYGVPIGSNVSFGINNFTQVVIDPYDTWLVTSNKSSNKLTLWNISIYNGWNEFNPYNMTGKNESQQFIDSFLYRSNFTIYDYMNTTLITFHNTSNTTMIQKINESYYEYNILNTGKYLHISTLNNISEIQSSLVNVSHFNITTDNLIIGLKPGYNTHVIYYGNLSYTSEVLPSIYTTTTYISNVSGTWTPPYLTSSVNATLIGGGGGGGSQCSGEGLNGKRGEIGSLVNQTINITYMNYSYTIGEGGAYGAYGGNGGLCYVGYTSQPGTKGGNTTFSTLVATGGSGGLNHTSTSDYNGLNGTLAQFPGDGEDITCAHYLGYVEGGNTWNTYCIAGGPSYYAGGSGAGYNSAYPGSLGLSFAGSGSKGVIQLIYNDYSKSAIGFIPILTSIDELQTQQSVSSIFYVTDQSLTGNIQKLAIPEAGGWIAASTDAPGIFHQAVSATGFGTQYSGSSNIGNAYTLAVGDSASYSTEGRGIVADIYDLAGTRKGTYSTGGTVNSVDISQSNSLWAVSGGNDGKLYIYSKDSTASWYVFYNGDSPSPSNPINSTSITWNGYNVLVGRSNNTLEYYSTQGGTATPASNFTASVFVSKGGQPYVNKLVTIKWGLSPDTATTSYTSGMTDGYGKFTFLATEKIYYNINVNANEHIFSYQATSSYPTITINIPSVLTTRPYVYSSVYNDTTNVITTKYDDINAAIVNIKITDMTTNVIVKNAVYPSSTTVTDLYTANGTHEYRVNIEFTRTTGTVYKDTLYVKSTIFGKVTGTPDQWKLFIWGVYFLFLMFVALGVGATSNKYGVVVLPALVVLGVIMGFLPMSIWLAPLGLSIFIAMTGVFRRDNNA